MSVQQIKAAVRKRDGNCCVDCGGTKTYFAARNRGLEGHLKRLYRRLPVHRVVPGSEYTVEGCVTLCDPCHARRHRLIKWIQQELASGNTRPVTAEHMVNGLPDRRSRKLLSHWLTEARNGKKAKVTV